MKLNKYFLSVIIIMFLSAMFRILNADLQKHFLFMVNFSPLIGLGLFGSAHIKDKRFAFALPLLSMLLSDCFLGFHNTMFFTYGSLMLITWFGFGWFKNKINISRLVIASLISSTIFFVITNFGVWAVQNMYPKNLSGLVECFTAAIPFFKNSLVGDLVFCGLMFGIFEIIKQTKWLVKAKA
jgi:hypothetical protein